MNCRETRQTVPTTADEFARKWATDLGSAEASNSGHPLPVACKSVARRLGLPVSSIDNIRRGRVKSVSARVLDRIRSAIISKIQQEMRELEHELEVAMRASTHPLDDEILQAQAALAAARSILKGATTNTPHD
ncbi:hypothetical protein UFOVP1204_57 [uncultured Caudovirales phage]|uniref:Uncharacterized protein n=1 Tax=uncultured Caudovirales phage TaxID=2100421 RepID=A0A6J5R0T2_9CAUD|nr:hypothetical protein UFOVP473_44 [uncultured Caudovirales phage]CAB4176672.1 hypothetical protein UFOVP983_44 [uncultured Caudovirales phage]CAB4190273.1 hypothetical protein UFOVP1204_57 [uncultured Caudovirales phage]